MRRQEVSITLDGRVIESIDKERKTPWGIISRSQFIEAAIKGHIAIHAREN